MSGDGGLAARADLWPRYKELLNTVENCVTDHQPGGRARLETALQKAYYEHKRQLRNRFVETDRQRCLQ